MVLGVGEKGWIGREWRYGNKGKFMVYRRGRDGCCEKKEGYDIRRNEKVVCRRRKKVDYG